MPYWLSSKNRTANILLINFNLQGKENLVGSSRKEAKAQAFKPTNCP